MENCTGDRDQENPEKRNGKFLFHPHGKEMQKGKVVV